MGGNGVSNKKIIRRKRKIDRKLKENGWKNTITKS